MPAPDPDKLQAARTNPAVLQGLPIVVTTAAGQTSMPILFSYLSLGAPLTDSPTSLHAWREVGQSNRLQLLWAMPARDYRAMQQEPLDAFEVEIRSAGTLTNETQFTSGLAWLPLTRQMGT